MHCCGNTPLPSWSCRESCGHTQRGARASADALRNSDSCPTTWASSMSASSQATSAMPAHGNKSSIASTTGRITSAASFVLVLVFLDEHRIKIIPRETFSSKPLVQLILGHVMNLFVATKTGSSIPRHSSHPSLPLTRTITSCAANRPTPPIPWCGATAPRTSWDRSSTHTGGVQPTAGWRPTLLIFSGRLNPCKT